MGDAGDYEGGAGSPHNSNMPIAVVGLSCRFPGDATSPSRLWDMLSAGKSAWSPIPKDKFNVDAFFHPNPDRNGTLNVRGGHFLQEDIGLFDCSFFNISPNEAKAIDPQQRLQLESAYEALENAGIPMEKVVGSDTSVYVGVFNRDYSEMLARDTETGPVYQATGNGQAILSNRISYFFDFKGPSITLDTACSASLSALHLACQSLRVGESHMALVGGTNMILSPDIMIAMSLLRFLSEDGRCYTYDHRAAGYSRGEGVATVVLKPLDDALRDGDPIRAVIRQTAVNQDGRTAGITLPSRSAQESLIRTAYRMAGLDPALTGYFEAHGTGTAAGDPLEAGAISTVFGSCRPASDPIIVGSVKTNLGHLEGASGLAGLIKAILILEHGMIPPNLNFEKANESIPLEGWNIKVPLQLQPWPKPGLRRASVNSFGYGGTNAHVILDDACNFLKKYQLQSRRLSNGTSNHHACPPVQQSRVFLLSANDDASGKAYAKRLASYIRQSKVADADRELQDLAFTLAERRSRLPYRLAIKAVTSKELVAALDGTDGTDGPKLTRSAKAPRLDFVFTGQGAQWFAMGRELVPMYAVFRQRLEAADTLLRTLGPTWSLMQELLRSEQTTRLDEPFLSQPVCTAVQLALVDTLASWGIISSAVVGHSSGEIAAAYAAGALDFAAAIKIAYFRGLVSATVPERCGRRGAMLAVGLGRAAAEERIRQSVAADVGTVTVACVNSPASTTVSGDAEAVQQLCTSLQADGVFARILKVGVAYHSHHMHAVADEYLRLLQGCIDPKPARPDVHFFSSVTGGHMADTTALTAQYWVRNMVSPVLFADAAAALCTGTLQGKATTQRRRRTAARDGVDILVEIGPHAALSGPLKQILAEKQQQQTYGPVLVRGKDAVNTTLDLVIMLTTRGYEAHLDAVNFPHGRASSVKVLQDLPPYAWNHTTVHCAESRISMGYRFRKFPRHDLVGAPVGDFNPTEPRWRNFIRLSENPWVADHQVARSILYPAAGMMVMAIEAMRQMLVIGDVQTVIEGYELRDVNIGKALVVPESAEGVETMLVMRPVTASARSSSDLWHEFRIFSLSKVEGWVEHSRGRIAYRFRQPPSVVDGGREAAQHAADIAEAYTISREACVNKIDVQDLYASLDAIGLSYGETFRNITSMAGGQGRSFGTIKIANTRDAMPYQFEHPYLIHPATLDCALQAMFPALAPAGTTVETAMVPTFVRSMFISSEISSEPGHEYEAWSEARFEGFKSTTARVTVVDSHDTTAVRPIIEISGMECASLADQSTPTDDDGQTRPPKLCFTMDWDVDVNLMTQADLERLSPVRPADEQDRKQIVTLDEVSYYYIDAALQQLSAGDVQALTDHCRLFYDWMVAKAAEVRKGVATNFQPYWLTATETDKMAAMAWIEAACVEGRIVCRMGANLARVLRREVEPLELMLQDDLLYDMYRDSMGIDRCYEHMAAYMDKLAHKNPTLRVLEIGAGTGGATLPMLQTLGGRGSSPGRKHYGRLSSYDFTDISTGFFEKARENFKDWAGLLHFRKLDIEQRPVEQGFDEGTYDVVVAANVLHATRQMRVTLDHVRRLLKPDGKLVLMEITERTLRMTLTLGNLPGWWLGAAEGRVEGPSLSVAEWDGLLQETGFSGLQMSLPDYLNVDDRIYSVITATAVEAVEHALPPILVVPPTEASTSTMTTVDRVIESIRATTVSRVSLSQLAAADAAGALIVFLAELESPLLATVSAADFDAIRGAIGAAKGIFWVARGGTVEGRVPEANLITGLSRTIRAEKHALKFVTLDLDGERMVADNSEKDNTNIDVNVIIRVFTEAFRNIDENQGLDFEYSERAGQVLIPRIIDDLETNAFVARDTGAAHVELAPFVQPGRPLKLDIGVPGLLDSLRFIDDPMHTPAQDGTEPPPLGQDEVDIDIRATGVNFKDIMVSMGQLVEDFLGCEVSGVVAAVGSNVTDLCLGDRVCAWTLGGYGTRIRNPAGFTSRIPTDMTFAHAASLPIVYCTAYHALFDLGRLQRSERVLIHAAAGGVGQAAIQLSQHAGANVFVTVGTEEKRRLVIKRYGLAADHVFSSRDTSFAPGLMRLTAGAGMDVIVNSLAGELLEESWRCIARFGRFVEIGKRDIALDSRLAMGPLERCATFASLDLTAIIRHNSQLGARILRDIMDLVCRGNVREVYPLTVYGTADIETAFRLMQAGKHVGKLVIESPTTDEMRVPVLTTAAGAHPLRLRPDASYLLVGGLGGLGRSLGAWLAAHGAHYLVFLSRSGTDNPAARDCVDELRQIGVQVAVYRCDVGDRSSLETALVTCRSEMPPIRGIIHGGMVLRDGIFDNMSHQDWQQALRPKIDGTRNLCATFADANLDFFTVLSSSVGVVGNFGQGNYAAASAFQDAVARQHATASGLPVVTIDLGMILGVGYVAENAHVEANLKKWGFLGIEPTQFLAMIKSSMLEQHRTQARCQIMTGLGTRGMVDEGLQSAAEDEGEVPFWFYDVKFSHLLQLDKKLVDAAEGESGAVHLAAGLRGAASLVMAQQLVCDALLDKMGKILVMECAELSAQMPMAAYGVDSLVAVELRNWIFRETRVDVPMFELLGSHSLAELCDGIARKSSLVREQVRGEE